MNKNKTQTFIFYENSDNAMITSIQYFNYLQMGLCPPTQIFTGISKLNIIEFYDY